MKKNGVYLDNCKTSKLAPEVLDEMIPYLKGKFWYPGAFTSIGTEIAEAIDDSQKTIADVLNAKPKEIIFTSGGTDANNIAIKGIMRANKNVGKHFITSTISHPAVLAIFQALEKEGYEGTYISANRDGYLNLEELKNAIRKDTVLVAFTHINHILGTIQKIEKIKNILAKANHKIYLFLDSCEAFAKIPIDVKMLGIDILSISAHKFNGPKGIGALFLKRGTKIVPIQHGITRLHRLKPGSVNVPAIIGMQKAVQLAFENFEEQISKLRKLQNLLHNTISERILDVKLNGPPLGERSPTHLNFSFSFVEGEAIMLMLDFEKIYVETGSACYSQGLKPNYILMQTGRTHEESHSSIRFTLDRFVTKEGILRTVNVLEKVIKELRRRSPFGEN